MAKSARTVWLLDDDPSVLKATGRLLASAGWEVESFIDPDAFLRHSEIDHPRVVVIDMGMPRMDGLEVQRRRRSVGLCRGVHRFYGYYTLCSGGNSRLSRLSGVGGGNFLIKKSDPQSTFFGVSRGGKCSYV